LSKRIEFKKHVKNTSLYYTDFGGGTQRLHNLTKLIPVVAWNKYVNYLYLSSFIETIERKTITNDSSSTIYMV